MRRELPGLTVTVAGESHESSSTLASVGGYVVVVATTAPRLRATLTSAYLGAIDGDTAATHLLLAPDRRPELLHRILPAAPLSAASTPGGPQPETAHARSCVLDHAAELQQLLAELADDIVKIDVGPAALERAAAAWPDDPVDPAA